MTEYRGTADNIDLILPMVLFESYLSPNPELLMHQTEARGLDIDYRRSLVKREGLFVIFSLQV